MESPSNTDLPTDIIRVILLRLPVKILSKLKCVCKDWYTLIENKSFINDHFINESNRERLLIFKPDTEMHVYGDESCSELDHLPMPERVYDVMGPVNGVFCVIGDSGGMGLFNPAIRQFKPLPLLPFHPKHSIVGFGLDPLSGYYKVVSICVNWNVPSYPVVRVYNSGTHSWRLIENVDILSPLMCVLRSQLTTYVNGVYYWVMRYMDNGVDVLAFNMSSDEFQIIQIPDDIRPGHELGRVRVAVPVRQHALVVCGDSIAILSYKTYLSQEYTFFDMWVLENDGRWTNRPGLGPFRGDLRLPIGFWKNNELILHTSTALLTMCNIFTHESRYVEGSEENTFRWIFVYKESLVSIGEWNVNHCKHWDMYSDCIRNLL